MPELSENDSRRTHEDTILGIIDRIEKRVIAFSYLAAKIVSVLAVLGALALLEAGVLHHLWKAEFPPNSPVATHEAKHDAVPGVVSSVQ